MISLPKSCLLLPVVLGGTILSTALLAQAPAPPDKSEKRAVRATAPPKKGTDPLARKGREILVIDGTWRFLTDPQNMGEQSNWPSAPPSETKEITVPSLWTNHAAPGYTGASWYWREFEVSPKWKTQTVRLRFEAVAEKASVWLNGDKLGDHDGGATPFEFNVTKKLHPGAKNLVAVRVEGDSKRGAGIWQGVLLMAHDEAYLSEVALSTGGLGQLTSAITLDNTSDNSGVAVLEGRVVAAEKPDKEIHRSEQNLSLTPGRNITTMHTSVKGKNLHPWTLETPALYNLQFVFRQGPDVLDTQQTTFGFREVGWKENTITLNGLPFALKSVAPSFPLPVVVASAEDVDRARTSFQHLKEAGVTVLFLDAPHPELLRIADEVGIFIVESPRQGQSSQAAFSELQALILRDRSHPSVLAWRLRESDATQLTTLRKSDPSRFILTGSTGNEKLFAPGEVAGAPVAIPPGFLPGI